MDTPKKREYRSTVRIPNDLEITVKVRGRQMKIGAALLLDNRFHVKRGRGWSKKIPVATLTRIFEESRKWANRQLSLPMDNAV
jgi:hypothetical protein